MKRLRRLLLAVAAAVAGSTALQAQSGDPDRIDKQMALAHAAAIENAWSSVAARIGVTDVGHLWDDEWDGVSDPPVGDWWLHSWTRRGLTARYCDGVLAVYAEQDELRGVGRAHRAVQVAPVVYANQRSGLHLVTQGSRVYTGSHGRDDGALPGCMPILSTTGDRVALVSEVADPKVTAVGLRWVTEDRTVACPGVGSGGPDTGTMVERRRIPIQMTAVENCPPATPNCNYLRELASVPPAWPADCAARETMLSATPPGLAANAACSDWARWRSNCTIVYAAAPTPADIPDAVITWETAPVETWTRPCACTCSPGDIVSGSCIQNWAQNTEWRVFVLRPGVPELRTRWPARVNGGPRLVNIASTCACTPPPEVDFCERYQAGGEECLDDQLPSDGELENTDSPDIDNSQDSVQADEPGSVDPDDPGHGL